MLRIFSFLRVSLVVAAGFVLTACGGGSSSNNDTPLPDKQHTYSVSGTISGLGGSTLVLANTDSTDKTTEQLSITGDGAFTFKTPLPYGAVYIVSVSTPPTNLGCKVDNGTNPNNPLAAAVTNVQITCSSNTYTVGGTVAGLTGTGLQLQNNGGDSVTVVPTVSPGFTFPTPVSGGAYAVTVSHQPTNPTQTCAPTANASNAAPSGNITNVVITCATNPYKLSGSITGLSGSGLQLQLQVNGATAPITTTASSFAASSPVLSGSTYTLSVITQPSTPSQTCTVANGSGTVGSSDVTNIAINCATNTYTIGGTITSLSGTGLQLLNNGGDALTIAPGATSFTFHTPIASGALYSVTLAGVISSPTQTCSVTSGSSGTVMASNVINVTVVCATTTYTVGGSITGLHGSGLQVRNGGETLSIAAGTTSFMFHTPIASGAGYAVTLAGSVSAPAQTCTLDPPTASGVVGSSPVTTVAISCISTPYSIGGKVTGLGSNSTGVQLALSRNGTPVQTYTAMNSGPFTFSTPFNDLDTYSVTMTAPSNYNCIASNTSGAVMAGNVTTIAINCTELTYAIGVKVSGLGTSNAGLVLADTYSTPGNTSTAESLPITGDGSYNFITKLPTSSTYAVTVFTPHPDYNCTISSGSSSVGTADVSINVDCTAHTYTVSASVTGLVGSGLVITDNGTDNLPVTSDGTFTFATKLKNTDAYAVTVASQPTSPTQTCTVANGSGNVARANVPPITITCSTLTYTVGGNVTGLAGSGLVLQDNGGDNLSIGTDGTFVFHTAVASGASYNVTVLTPPTPAQLCTVTNGSGTVVNALVNTVTVNCTSNFGHFAYVSNSSTSTPAGPGIWQYAMDPFTGVLTPMPTATIGTAPVGSLAIHPSNKFAFATGPGFSEYLIGTTTGALSNTGALAATYGSWMAIDPSGRYIYVPGQIDNYTYINGGYIDIPSPAIFGLSIDSTTGQFTNVSTLTLGYVGTIGVRIAPSGQFLYALQSLGSAYVEEYSLSNGLLTDRGVAVSNAAGATGLTIHPNGLHMYVSGVAANSITQYDIDATGALTLVQSAVAAGTAPGAITIDPSGRFAYALSSTDSSIAQFNIDPLTGALTAMAVPTITTGPSPTAMAIESAGRYAYVTCAGDSTIIQYTIGSSGALTTPTHTITTSPIGTPSSIAIAAGPTP